jgi:3-oxoacyl-[acyl-carrier protein] reductase
MSDRYSQVVNAPLVSTVAKQLGLPQPVSLDRYKEGAPVVAGPVLSGAAPDGRLDKYLPGFLDSIKAERAGTEGKAKALIFDATGIADSTELVELQRFFYPAVGRPQRRGPGGKGSTAQLVYVEPGAEDELDSTLRFLLSPRSAYVSGQVVRVGKGVAKTPELDWERPLAGKVALVTGASRGIGAAIAATLGRDGAKVVGLDIPQAADDLRAVTGAIDGEAIGLDITAADAPERIASHFAKGGVDIVVHNAGVTKDRTIAKMPEERWAQLMEINLSSEERINDALLDGKRLNANGRIVCVSSMSGIAGNSGQTNYAASKAGVIGMVESMAPELAKAKATINAVGPGFIETKMTGAMPIGPREAGRRLSSLSQGGLPVDVAETIAWFASPASTGVNGNTVRVCGQSLLGA